MKTLSILIAVLSIILCVVKAEQTNQVFITENLQDADGNIISDRTRLLVLGASDPLSKPASEDSKGNWGKVAIGAQVSIRFTKDSFTNGEPIVATVIVRNVSAERIGADIERLKIEIRGSDNKPVETIAEKNAKTPFEKSLIQSSRLSISHGPMYISPNAQRKCVIQIDGEWDIRRPGKYSVDASVGVAIDHSSLVPEKGSFATQEAYRAAQEAFLRKEKENGALVRSDTASFEVKE